jgi:mRNA interferase RelE/StbE
VRLTEPAFDDLRALLRQDPQIVRWALKKMLHLEVDPEAGVPLHGGLAGWRKLVVGNRDWRLVWRVTYEETGAIVVDVAGVWAVGARADAEVYAEMSERVGRLRAGPVTLALTDVIGRLGRVAEGVAARPEPETEPEPTEQIPDWLVRRLTAQAGMSPSEVVELSLEQALDAWTSWASRPRE